ncbi:MAG: DNA-directed RNA polymerase subunit beta [Deltaproteobacteria bacterium]|jgi:DNA-directed RNA polymerase subunit beta|nr:DNA-directed RNA polymerase subunit beta [Deltaproteobacteria bacterium]
MPSVFHPRVRKNFGKTELVTETPNLLETQRRSYERFLQKDAPAYEREDYGLQAVFKSVFPISTFSGSAHLKFLYYALDEVKSDPDECLAKGLTYEVPLKLGLSLEIYAQDNKSGAKKIKEIKELEFHFGSLPLMTERGTFIISGAEFVVVPQLGQSPGVFFNHDQGKTHALGTNLYSAKIIPSRGASLELDMDHKDIVYARFKKGRKFPASVLLKALGYDSEELLNEFYEKEILRFNAMGQATRELFPDRIIGQTAYEDVVNPRDGRLILRPGDKIDKVSAQKLAAAGIKEIRTEASEFYGLVAAKDVYSDATKELIISLNEEFTERVYDKALAAEIKEIPLLRVDQINLSSHFRETICLKRVKTKEEAMLALIRTNRPALSLTLENAKAYLQDLFFNPKFYDLSPAGRLKLSLRLKTAPKDDASKTTLTREDVLATVKELVRLKDLNGQVDDLDDLGSRRVMAVGELLENEYRAGLFRMARKAKEWMRDNNLVDMTPYDLVDSKPVSMAIQKFFWQSHRAQIIDQNNPLAEIAHKRRLSALSPDGWSHDRAWVEARDIHPTHYGRLCPLETPSGARIGLIVSLATYARVNEYGFIETPYRLVINRAPTKEVGYLTAMEEADLPVAEANAPLTRKGRFLNDLVPCRLNGDYVLIPADQVRLMDVSPQQMVSVGASLIPFLERDDPKRAVLAVNWQRQATPLLKTEAPLIGTGLESAVARDSGLTILAERDGVVEDARASRVVMRYDSKGPLTDGEFIKFYKLNKFQRSNKSACFNQKLLVKPGESVKKGQVIVDGPATDLGELALGRNVTVAFMSYYGYNFEDSILVSERLVKEDVFTSFHVEVYEAAARDTKLGPEEITRDIPNHEAEDLANLDAFGIIKIGREVKTGDILVGRITPKAKPHNTPTRKLLRAIFGEKAQIFKDSSLKTPPGVKGVVIDTQVFYRKDVERDERSRRFEADEISRLMKDQTDELTILAQQVRNQLIKILVDKTLKAEVWDGDQTVFKRGKVITHKAIAKLPIPLWLGVDLVEDKTRSVRSRVDDLVNFFQKSQKAIRLSYEEKVAKVQKDYQLPPGVIKSVKVFVAMKRKLAVGDKMSGRHGDAGVVSRILPAEDMPFFEDGTPVDVVLNPLSPLSRMNLGQIMETHLGWASLIIGQEIGRLVDSRSPKKLRAYFREILGEKDANRFIDDLSDKDLLKIAKGARNGLHLSTPAFDGANESEIRAFLRRANLPENGQTFLRDGRTGEKFENEVTVGVLYMLKLNHLVDDKIHARSIGPYSIITQQPLAGKALLGGQRFGEMEVWAMAAYGAAYSLKEFLTVKSDDVDGRARMYEKIVKGDNFLEAGPPENFKILVKELMALGIEVEALEDESLTDKADKLKPDYYD